MKFGLKHYFEPTPTNIRKIADAWLASSALLTALDGMPTWVVLSGVAAKFLSNLFANKR